MTINPSMTAHIGTYNFVAISVVPSTLDAQTKVNDTATTLFITGYTSDPVYPHDRIALTITNYKGVPGTYSIVEGQASGVYYHSVFTSFALGGIVSISKVTNTSLIGYFSFNTQDGLAVQNGTFNVGLP